MPRELFTLDRACYIHQSNHFPDDRDFAAVCSMVRNAGFNLLKIKALDGGEWMSTYDRVDPTTGLAADYRNPSSVPAPWAITGPARWTELSNIAWDQRIRLIPWCVPHGDDLDLELGCLLALADVTGDLIELDIEPYPGFWQGNADGLITLVTGLKIAGVTVWIDLDSRPYAAEQLPLDQLAPMVDRWLAQDYWTTFQAPEIDTVARSADLFARIGAKGWGSIFPHDGPVGFHDAAIEAAARDADEIGFWLLDYADSIGLQAWQDLV